MIRLCFSFFVTVVLARWMYAEVQMVAPGAVPVIDFALQHVQIPTHDRWDKEAINSAFQGISGAIQSLGVVQQARADDTGHGSYVDHKTYNHSSTGVKLVSYNQVRSPCASGACEHF